MRSTALAVLLFSLFSSVSEAQTRREVFDTWAGLYLTSVEMDLPVYERTAMAITKMYRQGLAPGPYMALTDTLLADPYTPFWGYCGSSVRLYRDIVAEYGFTTTSTSHYWNANANGLSGHVTAEVSGPGLDKPVFIDVLYGEWLVDSSDERMGIMETVVAQDAGMPVTATRTAPYVPAADPAYENINSLAYHPNIYLKYWNAIHLRTENYTRHAIFVRDTNRIDEGYLRSVLEQPGRFLTFYFLGQ